MDKENLDLASGFCRVFRLLTVEVRLSTFRMSTTSSAGESS